MSDGAWIGEFVAGAFYIVVGMRLARLASRTHERAELLLAALFILSGVSYILYVVPLAVSNEALWTPCSFAGRVIYVPAPVMIALFTQEVFRRGSRLSTFIIYLTAILLVVGVVASAMTGDWVGYSLGNPFFWVEWLGYTIPLGWTGMEAFRQYRSSLLRYRMGFCDRMNCNRLLLWSCFGICQVSLSFVLLGLYAEFEVNTGFSTFWDGLTGVLEVFSITAIWLIFFPSRFYQKVVMGSDAHNGSVEES